MYRSSWVSAAVAAPTKPQGVARSYARPPVAPQIPRTTLRHIQDNLDKFDPSKPLFIQAAQETAAPLQQLCKAEALAQASFVHDPITLIGGKRKDGSHRFGEKTTLADMLAPVVNGQTPEETAFFVGFLNESGGAGNIEPYKHVWMPKGTKAWVEHFRQGERHPPLLETARPDKQVTTTIFISVGIGDGAGLHDHGANLFTQGAGRKLWRVLPPTDYAHYRDTSKDHHFGGGAHIQEQYKNTLTSRRWKARAHPGLPQPMHFVTGPGDMVYLPSGYIHGTWNLDDYTYSHVKIRIGDDPHQY